MRVPAKATKIFAKKGKFMTGELGIWTKPDGRVCVKLHKEFGASIWHWLTPQEAVEMATKIINHSYPFTRPKRTVEIRDPGPKVKNFSYWDTTEGKMEYINQGCHRA